MKKILLFMLSVLFLFVSCEDEKEKDCAGVEGGTAMVDSCDVCVGGTTNEIACTQDCNGVFGGTATVDSCAVCVGGTTNLTACTQDCAGDWGGTAVLDNCWSADYSNHDELMDAIDKGYVTVTKSASSESECSDPGEIFFWCGQPGSSTDDFDYCAMNGLCPVNSVHGGGGCCFCGGCLVTCVNINPEGGSVDCVEDCLGNLGGTAVLDCDGVCGGSAIADCTDCTGNFNPCGDGTNDCDEFNNYTDDYCGSCSVHLWGSCYNILDTGLIDPAFSGLTGVIPPEIGHLVNLEILKLQNNQLSGEIPSEIGNLINLGFLNLENNQLSGEIPSEIGNLINLNTLKLKNNQLTGEIPQAVCDLIESNNLNISYILDGNNLTNTCD